jgi:hypothetical protein
MRIGNLLASIAIVLGVIGFLCLPLFNFHESPYLADPLVRGSGWRVFIQTGIFSKIGIFLLLIAGFLFLIAKLLPKKYWKTEDDLFLEEAAKNKKKRH